MGLSFNLADGIIRFITDITGFKAGLNEAEKEAKAGANNITAALGGIAKVAFPLGIGAGLVALAKGAIDAAAHMKDLSDRTGMSAEDLSRLDYAAKLTDTSIEGVSMGLKFFSRTAKEAREGNAQAVKSFHNVGVEVEDLKKKSPHEIIYKIADAFKNGKIHGDRMTAAMGVFSRQGVEMIPILMEGKDGLQAMADESDRVGYTISSQFAADAEAFGDNVERMKMAGQGFVRNAVSPMMSTLTQFTKFLNGDFKNGAQGTRTDFSLMGTLAKGVSVAFIGIEKGAEIALAGAVTMAKGITGALKAVITPISEIVSNALSGKAITRKSFSDILDHTKAAWKEASDDFKRDGKEFDDVFKDITDEGANAIEHILNPALDAATDKVKGLGDEADTTGADVDKLNESLRMQALQLRIQAAEASNNIPALNALREQLIALQVASLKAQGASDAAIGKFVDAERLKFQVEDAKRANEIMNKDLARALELQNDMYKLGDEARIAQSRQTAAILDNLWAQAYADVAALDQQHANDVMRVMANLAAQYRANAGTFTDVYATAIGSTEELFGSVFEDAITGHLDKIDDAFKSFLHSMLNSIIKFLAQQAVLKLLAAFTGTLPAANVGLGALNSSAPGTLPSSGGFGDGGKHFAKGGIVTDPTIAMIGEGNYNEAVIPMPDNKAVPVQLLGGGDGGSKEIVINQRIVLGADLFGAMKTSEDEIVAAVNKSIMRNGEVRNTIRRRT